MDLSFKLEKSSFSIVSCPFIVLYVSAPGCWKYQRDCDRVLVQSVSVQVRGQVLQKLGTILAHQNTCKCY